MYLIRDIFRCRPGKAGEVARRFKQTIPSMESEDGFRNCRVLLDYVASYWAVVLQAESTKESQAGVRCQEGSVLAEGGALMASGIPSLTADR